VDDILKKIGALDKPQVLVLNKVDKVINSPELLENSDEILLTSDKKSVIISTEKGWNLDKLFKILKDYAKTKTLSFKTSKEH